MNEKSPDNVTNSVLNSIVQKLTPRLLTIVLIAVVALLAIVIVIALSLGGTVDLKNLTFAAPQENVHILQQENTTLKKEISGLKNRPTLAALENCQALVRSSIPLKEISTAISEDVNSDNVASKLKTQAESNEEYSTLRRNFNFKLFLLEKMIPEFGTSIATHYDRDDRRKAYILIQEILLELGYHEGSIDGAQSSTEESVRRFQLAYNEKLQQAGDSELLQPIGAVGFRTLEVLRSAYRNNAI